MKRFIKTTLFALIMLTIILGSFAIFEFDLSGFLTKADAAEYTNGYYTYTLDDNNNATITKINYYYFGESISLPSTLDGYTVIAIGENTFASRSKVKSVVLPDTITTICDNAFEHCYDLSSIKMSKNLTSIGDNAFYYCQNLFDIEIPEGVNTIGDCAFYGCYNLNIKIPVNITNIGVRAFEYVSAVHYQGTPEQWSNISVGEHYDLNVVFECDSETPYYAKGVCGDNLSFIVNPDHELIISGEGDMYDFAEVSWEDFETPWESKASVIKSVIITEGVTRIGNFAFRNCEKIESVTLPAGIKSIGYGAFGDLYWKFDVYYPGSMEQWNNVSVDYDNDELIDNMLFEYKSEKPYYTKGTCGENLTCFLSADGELTITGTGEMYDYDSLPWKNKTNRIITVKMTDGLTVIGEKAFFGGYDIESVSIPDSVTSIGSSAFNGCSSLGSITMPDSVTSIGYGAFSNCHRLSSIIISDSVTSIGGGAFSNCENLKSITIPDSVTSIGGSAFNSCVVLESIALPSKITVINSETFYDCKKLKNVTIPDSVTSIGDSAFYGCTSLGSITIPDGVTSIGSSAFNGCTSLGSITISDGVTSIGSSAFNGCTSLGSITIPDGVTSIGSSAFNGCTSLGSITIPDGVTSIGADVLGNSGIYNDESRWENNVLYIGNHLIAAETTISGHYEIKNGTKTVAAAAFRKCANLTKATIPNTVKIIPHSAFQSCTSLEEIIIPDSIEIIENTAFYNCKNLKAISIPNTVKIIPSHAFDGCTSLTEIIIPGSVESIEEYAFRGCKNLKTITIPNSVTHISWSSFYDCGSLETAYFLGTAEQWNSIVGGHHDLDYVVIIESDSERPYAGAGQCGDNLSWILYADGELVISGTGDMTSAPWVNSRVKEITILEGATSICDNAFSGIGITSITIPDSVTTIGNEAFNECVSLETVTIPDSVTKIGKSAFSDCSALKTVVLGKGITSISEKLFYYCKNLTTINLNNVKYINDDAFYNCDNLANVTFSNNLRSIDRYAFYSCDSLEEINIPSSVYEIEISSFRGNILKSFTVDPANEDYSSDEYGVLFNKEKTQLIQYPEGNGRTSYSIPDGVTSIYTYAFYSCDYLVNISFPDGIEDIYDSAFYGCKNLTDVTLPKSLEKIYGSAFSGCNSLTSITIPSSVTLIDASAFYSCKNLTNIEIPDSCTNIYSSAFNGTGVYNDETNWDNGVLYIGNHLIDTNSSIPSEYSVKDGTKNIACYAFDYNITSITLPYSMYRIGEYAFYGCKSLSNITIPNSVTEICDYAFENCTSLKNITIPENVTKIGNCAFENCSSLKSITIPNSMRSIGASAFWVNYALNDVYYNGTESEWNNITIGSNNYCLTNATIHFMEAEESTTSPSKPPTEVTSPNEPTTKPNESTTTPSEPTTTKPSEPTTKPEESTTTPSEESTTKPEESTTKPNTPPTTESISVAIRRPSADTISYGDSIILHADVNGTLPHGAYIVWTADNSCFKMGNDKGVTCTITPSSSGDTVFTATVYDKNGDTICSDEQKITSKAGFFQKIIAFFKKLFGLTKTIPQIFKGII